MNHVKIVPHAGRSDRFKIEIDDVDFSAVVRRAQFDFEAGELPTVGLELIVVEMPATEARKALVYVGAETVELLTASGWKPPTEGFDADGLGNVRYPMVPPSAEGTPDVQ